MKKIVSVIAALCVSGSVMAGTLTDSGVEDIVETEAESSSAGWVPLLLVGGIAALILLTGEEA